MYAFLSRLAEPFTLGLVVLVLALGPAARRLGPGWRRLALVGSVVVVLASSWPPVAWVVMRGLETAHADRARDAAPGDPIVVLGGGLRPRPDGTWDLAEDSLVRTLHGARLYQTLGPRLIVVSGGPPRRAPDAAVARPMRELLVRLGVPDEMILVDGRSRSTHENAIETARLLQPRGAHRILLVTQAYHMPRSVRVFAHQGFEVLPSSADHPTPRVDWRATDLLPDSRSARQTSLAAHEYLGLLYYRLTGRL